MTILLPHWAYLFHNQDQNGHGNARLSRDYETASLMGIDINKIISITFFMGSFSTAVGGIMWGARYPQLMPLMGVMPGLKSFIAAVVGGIGNIAGAVAGGFLLGLGEIMLVALLPRLTGYRDAFAFVVLIIILLFKPSGLMGQRQAEKD